MWCSDKLFPIRTSSSRSNFHNHNGHVFTIIGYLHRVSSNALLSNCHWGRSIAHTYPKLFK